MPFQVVVRAQAQREIEAIFAWYQSKEYGLGNYFILCLDASLQQLKRNPTVHRKIRHEYRRFLVRKFPVGIYYIVRDQTIYIDVIEPLLRDPKRLDRKLDS